MIALCSTWPRRAGVQLPVSVVNCKNGSRKQEKRIPNATAQSAVDATVVMEQVENDGSIGSSLSHRRRLIEFGS
jgi:hypothetical protein